MGASITLPSEGVWSIANVNNEGLSDLLLEPPGLIKLRSQGIREIKKKERRERNKNRYLLDRMYRQIERSARENEGKTIQDIDLLMVDDRFKANETANVFLIPSNIIKKDGNRWRRVKDKKPFLLELNPLIKDGKHWVVFTNGKAKLVEIDQALIKKHGINIKARKHSLEQRLAEIEVSADYKIVARLKKGEIISVQQVSLKNLETGKNLDFQWTPEIVKKQDTELLKIWATQRLSNWEHMLKNGAEGYLPYWLAANYRQYDLTKKDVVADEPRGFFRRRQGNRTANLFGVLGGRAAIRETLQLQQLALSKKSDDKRTIEINTIKGVEVKSHPFAEMLAGKKGGSLALADVVPNDRFFAWFANPRDLTQYLDGGSAFIFNAGSTISGKSNQHQLKEHYLNKIGVDSDWAQRFLESGAVTEMAVVLPDLFLQDGTDLTLILKLQQPTIAKKMLALLGIDTQSKILTHNHKYGKSYWSLHNDLLLISTHAKELERVHKLATGDKQKSLGQSSEFKYMLTQLPIEQKSHSFFYFSDPFIRNLVGSQVKIAQLRRLQARTEMESVAAARLLYKVDGNTDTPSLEKLIKKGYINAPQLVKDIKLETDGSVSSPTWGTPANMPTLLEKPVSLVNALEKKAYQEYLTGYNRFWRRFFDPIAIRLNRESENQMEVSTFILPLIDNSIYQQLRQILVTDNNKQKLSVPQLTPEPVAQLSFNINKKLWDEYSDEFIQKFLTKIVGVPPKVVDYFGPDVHLALGDGDPIIIMGSGGLAGTFGMIDGSSRAGETLALPFIVSLLTRPSALMIGLTDVDAVRNIMQNMVSGPSSTNQIIGLGDSSFAGIKGKDAWRYELNIEGIIGMRFGIEIKDRYLVISNQPLSYNPEISKTNIAFNNGAALTLSPSAAVKQRPALFASVSAQQQKAAMAGINILYPFMLSGTDSIEKAIKQVKDQLGFLPVHPSKGSWQWKNGRLSSSVFGDTQQQFQVEYEKDVPFGALRDVERVKMNMQFEDDGLRAQVRWELKN